MTWLIFTVVPLMAWLSRVCGGGWPRLGRPWAQILFALPFGALLWPVAGAWAALGFLGAWAGKATGHGEYMDLGAYRKPVKPEKLDFLVRPFFGPDPYDSAARDAFGLAVTGLAVSVTSAVIMAAAGEWRAAAVLALGGALGKPLAYFTGWRLVWSSKRSYPSWFPAQTEIGEILTGLIAGMSIGCAWLLI